MNFSDIVQPTGIFCDGDWIEKKDQDANGDVRLIQLADIGIGTFKNKSSKFLTSEKAEELKCTYLQRGDILIARMPDPLGRACIFPYSGKYITAVDVAVVRINPEIASNQYVMHMVNSPQFRQKVSSYETGTTRKRISRKNLGKIEFELPALEEQERIVARIEELFSELDKAEETLRTTKQQLGVYRQAVLKEAFDNVMDCAEETIQSVCSHIVDCPHSTPKWVNEGKLCLRTTNFRRGYLDLSEKNYVSDETFEKRNIRLTPQSGDVLYSREGAILGIACMIPEGLNVCLGQRMMLLRTSERLINRFLMYYLNSPKVTTYVANVTGGSASPHVNVGDIKKFKVPVPALELQEQILQRIESQLSVCDGIGKTVDNALRQSKAMRRSILKKAFEGGL